MTLKPPLTRVSLLLRLRDPRDIQAWHEFVDLYAPLIYRYGRRHGLQDADAADLSQDVLHAVSQSIGRLQYDPANGTFRGWLHTIAHRRRCNLLTKQNRQVRGTGDPATDAILEQSPAQEDSQLWEEDYFRTIFNRLVEIVRPTVSETTWQAFWRSAVDGQSGGQVATDLGISVAAVYLAKGRVMARLREESEQFDEWDGEVSAREHCE